MFAFHKRSDEYPRDPQDVKGWGEMREWQALETPVSKHTDFFCLSSSEGNVGTAHHGFSMILKQYLITTKCITVSWSGWLLSPLVLFVDIILSFKVGDVYFVA